MKKSTRDLVRWFKSLKGWNRSDVKRSLKSSHRAARGRHKGWSVGRYYSGTSVFPRYK